MSDVRAWGLYLMPREAAAGCEGFILTQSDKSMWSANRIGVDGHPALDVIGNPRGRFKQLTDLILWLAWKKADHPEPHFSEWVDKPDWVKVSW